ncbi:MAG: AAA family ATPase, partial [Candidatus Methylomirabilaceae bacterium]
AGVGRIALVDGDLYFGDVATMLDIRPERTIHDLNGALDAEIADRFLTHHSSGVEILAAPARSELAEEITPDRFRTILSMLQGLYSYVVVDVTAAALETMLPTLDVADIVLILSTLDVVCLKDVSQVLDMLNKLRYPSHNILLVGNRFDERYSLNPKDAEKTLNMKFTAVLPRDDRVTIAANRGVPMTLGEPGAPFTRQVVALAKTITAKVGRLNHVSA